MHLVVADPGATLELPGWNRYIRPSCLFGHRAPGNTRPSKKMQFFATNLNLSGTRRHCHSVVGSRQQAQGMAQGGNRHGQPRATVMGSTRRRCAALARIIAAQGHIMSPEQHRRA